MKRPTLLDITKTSISTGITGELKCPACDHIWRWRLEHGRQFETGTLHEESLPRTPEEASLREQGFVCRILQEVIQHFAEKHP